MESRIACLTTKLVCIFARVVTLSLIPLSCLADMSPDYPTRQARDCTVSVEKAGFAIGVQPVEDLKEQETYFHTKLAPKGFVPVFIVMQNGSSADSFLFDKTKITYGPAESTVSTPETRSKTGKGIAIASVATLSGVVTPAGMLVAMKLFSNASHVQQNILKKELQSKTLSPGGSAHGFLYVPVLKNVPREKIHLRVPIARAGTDEPLVLDLVF